MLGLGTIPPESYEIPNFDTEKFHSRLALVLVNSTFTLRPLWLSLDHKLKVLNATPLLQLATAASMSKVPDCDYATRGDRPTSKAKRKRGK